MLAESLGERPRKIFRQVDFKKCIAVTFVQRCFAARQGQDVITVRGLSYTYKRLDVKRVGDNGKLGNGTRELVNSKKSRRCEHGKSLAAMDPEFAVVEYFAKAVK